MLALAVTIHNLPEGMAVGVVFAGADSGATNISLASALAVLLLASLLMPVLPYDKLSSCQVVKLSLTPFLA